ncbi:MAG TPA: PP2C family serine/threonine-protein phosphatase [Ktedonobacteraceae bacterium]|nr:PP2C family serine/threonine-protein phosphatase [Ktedonobacteraceae bacterium]
MSLKLRAAAKTDVGRQREQNEDSPYLLISEEQERGLFIVADGMGGYRAGEVASKLAVQKISESLKSFLVPIADQPTIMLRPMADDATILLTPASDDSTIKLDATKVHEQSAKQQKTRKLAETPAIKTIEDALKAAVRAANRAILSYGEEQSGARGLGCTVTSALVQDDQAFIVNVGDSRTYLWRAGELKVLTRDHSLVQRLVEEKQIEPEDVYTHPQRNLIYRSLGAGHKSVEADVFHEHLQDGDTLLLCSDGLWEMVRRADLMTILKEENDPQRLCDRLIDMANAHGGEDNITAIVVQVRAQ